uniref:Polyadenylate-binding protein n=1 Tax=Arcella intermedia TaxID=1963864 RepID=A0A6B2L1L4_9EUKA
MAPTVTEVILYEFFKVVGPVSSIRLCHRFQNNAHKVYAYVNFQNSKDAEQALETLNYKEIQGRPCRIMWQISDPSIRRSGAGKLFLKDLPPELTPKDLSEEFHSFGDIIYVKIATDEQGKSKGFGFVQFSSPGAAEKAVEAFPDARVAFRAAPGSPPAHLSPFIPDQERIKEREQSSTNVFVKNLHFSIDYSELSEHFSAFGTILSAAVMYNPDGSSKCFGFVSYDSHESAQLAIKEMQQKEIKGKRIWCGIAQKKSERLRELEKRKGTHLYLKNFDDDLTEEKLRQYFTRASFGEIKSAKIMLDDLGNSRGFGFISFTTPQGTANALREMNGRPLPGSHKPLYVAYHEPKAIRQKKLALHFASNRYQPPSMGPMYGPPMPPVYYYPNQPVYPRGPAWPPYPVPPMVNYYPRPVPVPRGYPPQSQNPRYQQPRRKPGPPRKKPTIQTESGEVPLTQATLAQLAPEQQKMFLGEKLYACIAKTQHALAGKITGMLLEGWKVEDLLYLLYDDQRLQEQIAEAVEVLKKVSN